MAGKDENTYGFVKADADALVGMIGMGEEELPTRSPRQVTAIIIQTPAGGIPARVGTTVGKANCTIYRITAADALETTGIEVSVVNLAEDAVGGSVYGQAKRAAGRWVHIDGEGGGGGGGGDEIFAFELTASMAAKKASATISELSGVSIGSFVATADVNDPQDIFFLLVSGAKGLCMRRSGVYYIIQAKCPAV